MSAQVKLAVFSFVALAVGAALGYGLRDSRGDAACVSAPAVGLPAVEPPELAAPSPASPETMTTITIKGADFDGLLANPDSAMRLARLVPNVENGVVHGFRLFGVRPDSTLGKSGLMNGDVALRLNELDLNRPEDLLQALPALRGATTFDIDIERHGGPIRLHYIVER